MKGWQGLFCLLIVVNLASAQPQEKTSQLKATVDFDWDPVPAAAGYEVELSAKSGTAALHFKSEKNSFSESVPLGQYLLRIRTKEAASGIYGAWSAPTEIDVVAKQIELIAPPEKAELQSQTSADTPVEFKWNEATGAKVYFLNVWSDDPHKVQQSKTELTSTWLKLPSAHHYHWTVAYETADSVSYANTGKTREFSLLGPQLHKPVLEAVVPPKVKSLAWSESAGAEKYHLVVLRHDLDDEEWHEYSNQEIKDLRFDFPTLPPGVYRIEIFAKAGLRSNSETDSAEFLIKPTREDLAKALRSALLR